MSLVDEWRQDFEDWAAKKWGPHAWRHTSGCCGEWDAYKAGRHAARAEALMEAAKSIERVDPFSFAIDLLRDKAKIEENQ